MAGTHQGGDEMKYKQLEKMSKAQAPRIKEVAGTSGNGNEIGDQGPNRTQRRTVGLEKAEKLGVKNAYEKAYKHRALKGL